ncbi:MAG: SDR family NAD(P)-dependent oxidoreductase, partial [Myxococcales bacterium]
MIRVDGKTAVITGASSGIGESCARKFVAAGARVVLAARSVEPLRRLAEELGADVAHAVPTDVADARACERLLDEAKTRFGSIDVLVNNAGIIRDNLISNISEQDWDQVLDVNLKGAFLCCQAVFPILRSQRSGKIINIVSLAWLGSIGQANYT